MHELLCAQTGGEGQCSFQDAVAAFIDMPEIPEALGFPSGTAACDIQTGAMLLSNMRACFTGSLSSNGTRFAEQRRIAEATA